MADPQGIQYVKTLVVGAVKKDAGTGWDQTSHEDDPEEAELAESDQVDIIEELGDRLLAKCLVTHDVLYPPEIQHFGYDSLLEAERWRNTIADGNADEAAALLITMLPHLQFIHVISRPLTAWESRFLETVSHLLSAAVDDDRGINNFSKLREIRLRAERKDLGAYYEICEQFMMLPSLLQVKGHMVMESVDIQDLTHLTSSLMSINFQESGIMGARLTSIISCTTDLSKFAYDYRPNEGAENDVDDEVIWQPRKIVVALRDHASHSLACLELTIQCERFDKHCGINFAEGEPFIGSLRDFEALESIRLDNMTLYKELNFREPNEDLFDAIAKDPALEALEVDWDEMKDYCRHGPHSLVKMQGLVFIFPMSTKKLKLTGGLPEDDALAMLDGLVEQKEVKLPNLKSIVFEDCGPFGVEVADTCAKAGIRLKYLNDKP